MKPNQLDSLIDDSLDDRLSEADAAELSALLNQSAEARARYWEMALIHGLLENSLQTVSLRAITGQAPALTPLSMRLLQWRPLTAAAAGIVFGMLCTSMVFGFVNQRAEMNRMPLSVFDAGLEDQEQILKDGLPDRPRQWGMDDARVVAAEEHVRPLQGERMMRLEPIAREKSVKNHTSRAYQVLDLRSQPLAMMRGEIEADVSASFCAANSDSASRYLIRVIALDEAPETATKGFWSKVESDGVVSESQRFDTLPGESGWHTFSMKLRLPPGSKTLVLIFGAVPPEAPSQPAFVHYLDDVQVSLLTSEPLP